jgi:ketosteroid isomerase-like protein
MSQKNVEIVRAAIDAFNRGDLDAALRYAAPNLEYDLSRATGPVRGIYALDRVRPALDEVVGIWESSRIEPHEFIEAGEHVVVPWTFHVAGRDGIEVQARTTWTFTIRATEPSSASACTRSARKPSKPPGSRGRQHRGRTSRSFAVSSRRGTAVTQTQRGST